jgi:hypothetical protein
MPDDAPELSSHGFTQGGFLGEPVLCPTLLPDGLDAALGVLLQHPRARKLYLSSNILEEEEMRDPFRWQVVGSQGAMCLTLSGSAKGNHC